MNKNIKLSSTGEARIPGTLSKNDSFRSGNNTMKNSRKRKEGVRFPKHLDKKSFSKRNF
jgi:hypothetical protein